MQVFKPVPVPAPTRPVDSNMPTVQSTGNIGTTHNLVGAGSDMPSFFVDSSGTHAYGHVSIGGTTTDSYLKYLLNLGPEGPAGPTGPARPSGAT